MLYRKIKVGFEREIRLMGIPICQYSRNPAYSYFSIFPKSFISKVLRSIRRQIGDKYDLVFILRCNAIGENYLLNFLYKEVMERKGANNACFILHSNNAHCLPMFRLFTNADVYVTRVPLEKLNAVLEKNAYRYQNVQYITYHCPLANTKDALYQKDNYSEYIRKRIGATKFSYSKLTFPKGVEECEKKLSGVNLDNFIFINPEVKSLRTLPQFFWENLIRDLKKLGYDVFINTKSGNSKLGCSIKCSIVEATYLASKARAVITMRTGFSELISTVAKEIHVIYTPSIFDDTDCTSLFSLKGYPFVNKESIFEYEVKDNGENNFIQLSNNILGHLTNDGI